MQIDMSSYQLRSDLERAAFEKRKTFYIASLKKKGYDNDSINAKVKTFRSEENHHNLEKLRFSSKEALLNFAREALGNVSRKTAVRLLKDKLAFIEIVSVKEDGVKLWFFEVVNRSHYRKMGNLAPRLLAPIKSFELTQNLADSDLRLGFNERVLLTYLENERVIMDFVWEQAYTKDPSIKWKSCLYLSQATIAYDLSWTVDQVRYSLKKLTYYFGEDFFRAPTKEEKLTRKDPRSWNFQINIPPFREWDTIISRKVRLLLHNAGRSVLRKEYTDEDCKALRKMSRKKKKNKVYKESSSNEGNKEYDRVISLGKYIKKERLYLTKFAKGKKRRKTMIKWLHDLIFGKSKIKKKFVPFSKASEYWKKKRAADKEKSDAKKEEARKKWTFYGTESCKKSAIGLAYAIEYGNYDRNALKKSEALKIG